MTSTSDPVVDQFMVGDARITRIEEWRGTFLTPQQLFSGFNAEAYAATRAAIAPEYLDHATDGIFARLQSWVIEHEGATIIVDTGAGNDKERPGLPVFAGLRTPFMERFIDAGFDPDRVDVVVCTHLHVDHVGWNTRRVDDRWVPTFANAEYVFPKVDADYWDPSNAGSVPSQIGAAVNAGFFEDSVRPIIDAGLERLVTGSAVVGPGLRLEPAPGHTPGSMTITLESAGERAMFCGDIVHHPLQILNPEWNSIFCEDGPGARASRQRTLAQAAEREARLIPAHFAGEHSVRVRREGTGFRPVWNRD